MTTVFVKPPLASPGSAKYLTKRKSNDKTNLFITKVPNSTIINRHWLARVVLETAYLKVNNYNYKNIYNYFKNRPRQMMDQFVLTSAIAKSTICKIFSQS